MGISPGLAAFKLSFTVSPLILVGGVASAIPGGMLPVISITQSADFDLGILSGGDNVDLDDFFAVYEPLPGSTLIDQMLGEYPFANQAVAANAVITQPLVISLLMICPVRDEGGYPEKLAIMTSLQATLAQHNGSGGTYIVATPSFYWDNLVMLRMTDASIAESKQTQNAWRLDFRRPLLTLAQAQQAQNALMSQLSSGTQINGQPSWSGAQPTIGNPGSLATPSVVPAASGTAGSNVAPSSPNYVGTTTPFEPTNQQQQFINSGIVFP